jgi:hypothetical protein
MSGSDEFLTVAEMAAMLKLNQQTVRNWIDQRSCRRSTSVEECASAARTLRPCWNAGARSSRPTPSGRQPRRSGAAISSRRQPSVRPRTDDSRPAGLSRVADRAGSEDWVEPVAVSASAPVSWRSASPAASFTQAGSLRGGSSIAGLIASRAVEASPTRWRRFCARPRTTSRSCLASGRAPLGGPPRPCRAASRA